MADIIPNICRRTLMICSNGFYLRVLDDRVDGIRDIDDKHVPLEMQSVAIGEIVLMGEKSMKYVSMDCKGNVTTTPSLSYECIFKEQHLLNGYNSYESKANTGWYLGVTKHGTAKKGSKTRPGQKAVLFLTGDVQ